MKKCLALVTALLLLIGLPLQAKAQEQEELKPLSFLLLGTDTGSLGRNETGRSDVIMVATINPITKRATITSIPRDTYVEIVGEGFQDKINHAYAFGGAEMAMATVNQLLGIDLDHYLVINMGGLEKVVDALGTIEVTPPTSFEIGDYTFVEGETVAVDGAQALAYVRERYTSGGDYARQERQREVIQAVVNKVSSMDSLPNLQKILTSLNENLSTDLSLVEMLNLYTQYAKQIDTIETYQISGTGTMMDGVYYDIADEDSLEEAKARILAELEV